MQANYAVFIPTYNASKDLAYFKRNLAVLKQLPSNYRVLFIDSSSKDNTVAIIHEYGFTCKIIPQAEFDHGRTRQLAAEILHDCEVIVYLTQDAELTSVDSIYKIVAAFQDPAIGTAFGRQLPHQYADLFASENRAFNYPDTSYVRGYADRAHYGIKCVFSSDSFAAYRASALLAVGGFPKHSIVSEDMYVAANMLKQGYKIAYVAEATCYHSHNYSIRQEIQRYFDIGVFFACEPWIKQEFGAAESEGKKAIIKLFKKIIKHNILLLPSFFIRIAVRIVAYKLGVSYQKLPSGLVQALTAQKNFWRNHPE